MGGNFLEERKFDPIARNFLDAPKPNPGAIAQFINLANLGPQNAAKMMSGLALNDRSPAREWFDEKSSSHAGILTYVGVFPGHAHYRQQNS